MTSLVPGSAGREPGRAPPDGVREAREAAGWTQERLADELGVLPAEVAAWESGAIALTPYRAAEMCWRMERAAYEAALPRSDCYWMRANAERLKRMDEAAPRLARKAHREREAHALECAECLRVKSLLRDAPPPPEPPLQPGIRGWRAAWDRRVGRLPPWLRMALRLAEVLVKVGAYCLGIQLLADLGGIDGGPSFRDLALFVLGFLWFVAVGQWLEPTGDRHPYVASLLQVAAAVVPAHLVMGLLGVTNPADPGSWILAAIIVVIVGWLVGTLQLDMRADDARAMDAEPDAEEEEEPQAEREVFIRQRSDGPWRP